MYNNIIIKYNDNDTYYEDNNDYICCLLQIYYKLHNIFLTWFLLISWQKNTLYYIYITLNHNTRYAVTFIVKAT